MTLRGIDISSYQGAVDWTKASAGLTFAIARCVRETGAVDPTFATNVAGIRKAGLIAGAYCFLDEGSEAAQAKLFVDTVKALGGPMLLVLDIERGNDTVPTVDQIRTFCGIVKNAFPTRPLFLYGSPGILSARGNLAGFGPWWRAHYTVSDTTRRAWDAQYAAAGGDSSFVWEDDGSGWTRSIIWQFSSRGAVAGITGNVDLNAAKITREQLEIYAGAAAPLSQLVTAQKSLSAAADKITTLATQNADLTAKLAACESGSIPAFNSGVDAAIAAAQTAKKS